MLAISFPHRLARVRLVCGTLATFACLLAASLAPTAHSQSATPTSTATSQPSPPTNMPHGSDLTGKVVCGYQGWFRTPSDQSGMGWHHHGGRHSFEPGDCGIDLWPDVSELPASARVDTPFRKADGSVAQVFSSLSPEVADMHFRWMQENQIDGVMFQRFASTVADPRQRAALSRALNHGIAAAERHGRGWALMYDLSGLQPGQAQQLIDDWERLKQEHPKAFTTDNPNHWQFNGKPLIALWGLGFNDRAKMFDDWQKLITHFKDQEHMAVMLGVPTYWRTLNRDTVDDPQLHDLIAQADIVSPWAVGRYGTPEQAKRHIETTNQQDLAWTQEHHQAFLPVCFPGFSWHNLMQARGTDAKFNQIPRLGGRFFWQQIQANHDLGAKMLYIAMFDEVDEGTAIIKWDNNPPVGESLFLTEPELPNDHYLWLTGQAGRLIRGETVPLENGVPVR